MNFQNLSNKLLKFIWKWLKKGIVLTFLGFIILGALFIPQVQTACLMILTVAGCLILAPLLGLAYFTYSAGTTTTAGGATPAVAPSGKFWLIILDVIGYCLLLWLIKSEYPNFWEKWNTTHGDPNDSTFFWISNIALFVCILAATVKFHRSWFLVGMIITIFFILHHCYGETKNNDDGNNSTTEQTTPNNTQEVEVLMYEGYTPCDVKINYHPRIRTEGFPLLIKWNGIKEPIPYDGVGDFNKPIPWKWGMQHIESRDSANPRVPIKVYKVVQATIS